MRVLGNSFFNPSDRVLTEVRLAGASNESLQVRNSKPVFSGFSGHLSTVLRVVL